MTTGTDHDDLDQILDRKIRDTEPADLPPVLYLADIYCGDPSEGETDVV